MAETQITESSKEARLNVVERVVDRLLSGATLKRAIEAESITIRTFQRWIAGDRELSLLYLRARETLMDLEVDEAKELADSDGDPSKVRNQIDIRKWRASKLASKTYGDRIDLNVTQTLDIGATLQEARARLLRPVSYQLEASDAQVIDLPRQISDPRTDYQSVDVPGPDDVPDIFR